MPYDKSLTAFRDFAPDCNVASPLFQDTYESKEFSAIDAD